VRDLGSTHPMLGALQPQDFGVDDRSLVLEPGDTLVAYTDGAFEARNRKGHKMGIGRLREAIRRQPPPSSWSDYLLQLVDGFSGGAREDDVLVAALTYLGKPAGTRVIAAPREASPREATPEPPVPA
jgi:serine phosphatase RsbU (regulator of sigma subunit)